MLNDIIIENVYKSIYNYFFKTRQIRLITGFALENLVSRLFITKKKKKLGISMFDLLTYK